MQAPVSLRQTATILAILYSRAVTIAATAACSAQKPVPEPVSIHTPENRLPASVTSVAATCATPPRRADREPITVCGRVDLTTASSLRTTPRGLARPSWRGQLDDLT